MDELGSNRATLMAGIGRATRAAEQKQQDSQAGQFDMFGVEEVPVESGPEDQLPDWTDEQRLSAEKETLGLYLTGHPYNRFSRELDTISDQDAPIQDLSTPRYGIFAGIMVAMRVLNTRRGKMAFITLDNARHRVEVSLFSDKFTEYFDKLQKDQVLIALGELSEDEFTGGCQMRLESLFDIEEVRKIGLAGIQIELHQQVVESEDIRSLQKLLAQHRGGRTALNIQYTRENGDSGRLNLGDSWKVHPREELIDQLCERFGADHLGFYYDLENLQKFFPEKPSYRTKAAVNH